MIHSNRLAIYAIGKIKKLWIRDGINQYKKRMPELIINELKNFNLDKLNKFKKKKNLNNESKNKNNYTNITKIDNLITNPLNSEDPNKIFYSLIDNSESLEETSNINNSLRESEINQINMNSIKHNLSKKLTTEEELYDEFNYLLDE